MARGARRPLLLADMPFGSYEESEQQAVRSAVRILKEANMDAVKVEGLRSRKRNKHKYIIGVVVVSYAAVSIFCTRKKLPPFRSFVPSLSHDSPFAPSLFPPWYGGDRRERRKIEGRQSDRCYGHRRDGPYWPNATSDIFPGWIQATGWIRQLELCGSREGGVGKEREREREPKEREMEN